MLKRIFKSISLLPTLLLSVSCSNNKNINSIKYPSYIGYSNITSSFLYDYVVDISLIKSKFDFIKDLKFNESKDISFDELDFSYIIAFIYKNESITNYYLTSSNKIYFNNDDTLYVSSLNDKYSSDNIIFFLTKNGKSINVSLLI